MMALTSEQLRNMFSVKTTATLIAFYENLFIASALASFAASRLCTVKNNCREFLRELAAPKVIKLCVCMTDKDYVI